MLAFEYGAGGSIVATYVLLTKVTAAGVKTLQSNPRRIKKVNEEIEAMGARVVAQYATLGRYDFVNIVEAKALSHSHRDLHPHHRQEDQIAPTATLLRGAALADGRSPALRRGFSILMRDGRVSYLGPDGGAPDPGGAEIVDASGATIIPGLVDCHAHFTGLGGANWIARFDDPEADLIARGAEAAHDLARMGILSARDVGAPHRLNIRIRDTHRGQTNAPTIVAAGTWLARRDKFPPFVVFVDSADELRRAAIASSRRSAQSTNAGSGSPRTRRGKAPRSR